jgi:hypothetical protein
MPTPKPQLKPSKLLKQHLSRNTFENTHHSRNRHLWRSRNKQMHMIAIMNLSSQQLIAMVLSNHFKYFQKPNLNWAD